jgi:phosphotransferase family enzyme
MVELSIEAVESYLKSLLGSGVTVMGLAPLGGEPGKDAVKGYGYGTPIRVEYQLDGGPPRAAVFHTMTPAPFGHEHMSDRARELLWEHAAFNHLPRHVQSLDVGGFEPSGKIVSLGKVEEFCLLTEYAEGQGYFLDLERIRDTGKFSPVDQDRADALCDYLVGIHKARGDDANLYHRRIRELVGDGECIMGLTDCYAPHPFFTAQLLEDIEHRCVRWRWRLKAHTHRSRQVHGDFHPWNILFGDGVEFRLLDRSRGEYGDPADDVTCLTANYLFFSLQRSGRLEGAFEALFLRFWERYLERSGDREMLRVVAPFFAFRGLVMASPLWYPNLPDPVRRKLIAFVIAVLDAETFDPGQVNRYCGA